MKFIHRIFSSTSPAALRSEPDVVAFALSYTAWTASEKANEEEAKTIIAN